MGEQQLLLCRYHYDPLDRLAAFSGQSRSVARLFYGKTQLAVRIEDALRHRILSVDNHLLAQQESGSSRVSATLLATDQSLSVRSTLKTGQQQAQAYSAYGYQPGESGLSSLLAFNGELRDLLTGHYLLGNGYRAYNPSLMRFNSPDSLSPFAEGGINAYAYCLGDPLNRVDPDGHWPAFLTRASFRTLSGLAFTAGIGAGLTAGLVVAVGGNSEAAAVLGGMAAVLTVMGGVGYLTTPAARRPAVPVQMPSFDPPPAYDRLAVKVQLPPRLSVDTRPPPAYGVVTHIRRASM